jgi:hypothetical protein
MPDNLSISIGIDSSKGRADLDLLKAQLRLAQKEARDFAKAGAEAGDKFPSAQLTAASNRVGALDKQLKSLNATTKQTSSVMDVLATKSMRRLLTQFDNVGKSAQNIAMVMGGVTGSFAGGFLAASVFKGLGTLIDLLGEAEKRLVAIRDASRQMGTTPLNLQAAQEAALRAGQTADVGTDIVKGIREQLNKAATETKEQTKFDGVKVMRGTVAEAGDAAQTAAGHFQNLSGVVQNTVRVFKGGVPVMQDFTDPLKLVGVDPTKFKDTAADALRFQTAVAAGFKTLSESGRFGPTQLNELSKILFAGRSYAEVIATIPNLIKDWDAQLAALGQTSRGVSESQILKQEDLDKAKERVNAWFREVEASGEQLRLSVGVSMNNMLADFLTVTLPAWKAGFENFWPQLLKDLESSWATMNENLKANFGVTYSEMFKGLMDGFGAAIDWMIQKANQLAAAVSAGIRGVTGGAAAGDPSIPAMPMASGGAVRGPGSGTSDSILARLSNGEFVMRAAAVSKWGPRFMAALNGMQNPFGYAGGGLVPRFAAGGLVAAGAGGTPVHLHLGGHSFALSGAESVVGALVTEAHRQRMRSAGTKPSWYGGH